MEVKIIERVARRDGTPPRCVRCGAICEPSLSGPVLCSDHRPRWGGADQERRDGRKRSRQAEWVAKKRALAREARRVVPIPEAGPRTYRERVQDRLRDRGLL